MNFLSAFTGTEVATNATAVNNGGGTLLITPTGGAGSVVFTLPNVNPVMRWDGTGTFAAGSGEIAMVRQSDLAAYQAGEFFTPEFLSLLATLHPRAIRTMGWTESRNNPQSSNSVKFAYRSKLTNFSWVNGQYPTSAWSGGANTTGAINAAGTGAGQVGIYTAAPAVDTPLAGWVANEVLLGNIQAAAPSVSISGAVSNGGKVQLTVSSSAALIAGQAVRIFDVHGTTEVNGSQTILTVDSATQVTINVAFVNAFVSGGTPSLGYQTLAVTGKSGGAKAIFANTGTAGVSITTGTGVFFYDSVLDVVIYTSGSVSDGPPIEAQTQLANRLNANLWYVIPEYAEDDFVTQAANLIYSGLNTSLSAEFELGNENWNFQFPGAQWMFQRAVALGIVSHLDYQGLRIRQIMGNLIPSSSWSAAPSRLRRLYMFQAGTGGTTGGDTSISGKMIGAALVSPGNAAYQAFVGGSAVNYNTSPNRPIDFVEAIGYAPYTGGLGLLGQSPDLSSAPTSFDAPALQSIADNYTAGSVTTAIATIDGLVRNGRNRVQTVTASGTTFTTPLAHNLSVNDRIRFGVSGGTAYSGLNTQVMYQLLSTPTSATFTCAPWLNGASTGVAVNAGSAGSGTVDMGFTGNNSSIFTTVNTQYTKWQNMAATAFTRPAGMSALQVEWYEGAIELTAPSAAQCLVIGVTLPGDATGATAAAAIDSAITAWKNDAATPRTMLAYYNAFMGLDPNFVTFGAMPNSLAPSQLSIFGPNVWSILPTSIPTATPYQTYDGIRLYNHSLRRMVVKT
ncbi:MAG TPA: hypothetical protein VK747_14905 [Blastocatellia bacterium]|nr:hypothetical protein [Blastocatellia bacterium]